MGEQLENIRALLTLWENRAIVRVVSRPPGCKLPPKKITYCTQECLLRLGHGMWVKAAIVPEGKQPNMLTTEEIAALISDGKKES
jgi:hypothetical protein